MPEHLDHTSSDELASVVTLHLPKQDGAGVILDCTAIELISSIGIAALLQVRERCLDAEAGLCLANLPQRQVEFLGMLRLDEKFDFAESIDDALVALEAGP